MTQKITRILEQFCLRILRKCFKKAHKVKSVHIQNKVRIIYLYTQYPHMLYDRNEIDFTVASVLGPRPLSYFPEFLFLPPFCFVVTDLRSVTLVVLVCEGSWARTTRLWRRTSNNVYSRTVASPYEKEIPKTVSWMLTWHVLSRDVCCVRVQWLSVSNDVAVKTITRGDHFRVINGWSACCVVGLVDLCQNLPGR